MEIVIHCLGMPFGPSTIFEQSLGGSESAAYYLAKELAARGHRVNLFTSRDAPAETVDGVTYLSVGKPTEAAPLGEQFEYFARNTPHDVLIIQRIPGAFTQKFAAKVCIWQLHDLALRRFATMALSSTWQADAITCVSDWHCKQVKEAWLIDESVLFKVPNGVDPDLYKPSARPFVKVTNDGEFGRADSGITLPSYKFNLLYQSRPERGLEHLVRPGGIMDRVKNFPIHLTICGYDNTVPQMAGYYQQLYTWAAERGNCSFVGALTKPQLAELQRKCDLMIYPTEFEEVSCISVMEAMHAGLPVLSSAVAALPETAHGAGVELLPLADDGKADEDGFVQWLQGNCNSRERWPAKLMQMQAAQRDAASDRTWVAAANRLEAVITECFLRRAGTDGAVMRTAIERSDIDFANWYLNAKLNGDNFKDVIAGAACDEIGRMYAFTESDESYAAHYARHQGIYYDGPGARAVGEDVTGSTRFRGVANLVEKVHRRRHAERLRVLDYGCAHGHYLFPLAREFPSSSFHGVDISERAVEAAKGYRDAHGIANAHFKQGAEGYLASVINSAVEKYDIIIACEVLEHVRDWRQLLDNLRACLKPDGVLIITTPYGRWEHSGTEAFRDGREHLVHFEKQDIREILNGHESEIFYAPASFDRSGEVLGSYIWYVKPRDGLDFGDINYERKLFTYCPRQTISLCMIVKDGATTLRKCVESAVDWVDEIRIAIDPTTTDRTRDVADELAQDFQNRPFMIWEANASALKDGFDAARNESVEGYRSPDAPHWRVIDEAAGDWILWADADEELHYAQQLHKLARASMHEGYGFAQMHYAISPPEVLTTDYPTRFFRNHVGIRFYGVVHEHPEKILGQAVPTAIVRPEVKFLHSGYVDEETRRRRYERNMPLLLRDREKYPERKLNQFLWMRDTAQGIAFELQRIGGGPRQHHIVMATKAIELYESMVPGSPVKILIDSLQYYSYCVMALGKGFECELSFRTTTDAGKHLNHSVQCNGRFHSRAFHQKLVNYLLEESTKGYESKYL